METLSLCLTIVAATVIAPFAYGQNVVAQVKVHNPSDEMANVVIRGTLPRSIPCR